MRGPFWSKKVMKKKKLKIDPLKINEEIDKEQKSIIEQEAQEDSAYSEYVAIKKAERKEEIKKEKRAEKIINNSGFIGGNFIFPPDINRISFGEGQESPVYSEGFHAGNPSPPEGVKALKGILPKAKKKNYNTTSAKPQYYLEDRIAPYLEPSEKIEVEHDGEILPDLESVDAKLPSEIEMFSQVREDIRIFRTSDRTIISAVIIDKQEGNNRAVAIRCYGGVAFGGYVRDCSGDAYLIEGIDYIHLGTIPFSLRVEIPKAGNWGVHIPIPEKVLMSSFAPTQLKAISNLRERYPEDKFNINYLQMLLAN